ncbi:ATP-dependent DNA ligase [Actinotalea ferrariae CF5-4]|uniref:ATP-dependent DNA ligase n=1 Tax=Actinotalea ferrariae CF5-4 TaxID=948458 RepID=A0A021VY28_9CELL|nr:non-homologous end-joining DNA ligase [Actinotalea ferrariae]EYR64900.1 ATP-dependent DNA ligase [Actinotalea ferrariae CF5-4]
MTPRGRDHAQYVEVAGRRVRLTNLDRVLYPETGFTKAEMIHYYTQVAEALLPQLRDRPVTRIRFPDTVEDERFFEKNVPAGAPDWVRHRVLRASPEDDDATEVDFPFLDDLAGLVWAANGGAVELHTPQWRVGPRGKVHHPDRLVIDLDPGPPAGLDECARVAHLVADRLEADGLVDTYPVTSGSKGMQLYAPLDGRRTAVEVRAYARAVAGALAAAHPALVLANMKRDLRPGKVLLDWSQNHPAKTTVTPYSLRGRALPRVAAPRDWEEIEPGLVHLGPDEVVRRLEEDGDLLADLR